MHGEHYELTKENADIINKAKRDGGRIVTVGTTSTRVVETIADANGFLKPQKGVTYAFFYPGYKYKLIDGLLTNFHWPKSSLILLVSAFYGRENTLAAYKMAVENKMKLFSYGDGMLILRNLFILAENLFANFESEVLQIVFEHFLEGLLFLYAFQSARAVVDALDELDFVCRNIVGEYAFVHDGVFHRAVVAKLAFVVWKVRLCRYFFDNLFGRDTAAKQVVCLITQEKENETNDNTDGIPLAIRHS